MLSEAPYPAPADRLAAAVIHGELTARTSRRFQRNASEAVIGWMNSPSHRATIMNGVFTEIGAGYAVDSTGRPYYVQVLGTPR